MKRLLLLLLFLGSLDGKAPLTGHPVFHRPFDEETLKSRLYGDRGTRMLIFTYGSLMNQTSASQSLSAEALATRRPAVAYGIRRLFNRDIPEELIVKRFGPLESPNQRGALNVQWTGNPGDRVNGLLIEADWETFVALCEREIGYDLIPVKVRLWGSSETVMAYTFSAPSRCSFKGEPLTSRSIMPIPGYYQEVREGAATYGSAFLREYLRTTYLADGRSSIAAWEKSKTSCRSAYR